MLQPPDPRDSAKTFPPNCETTAPSSVAETSSSPGWSVLAGIAFALARFSIGACFALMAERSGNDPMMHGVAHLAWMASGAAGVGAGIGGAAMFWRLRRKRPTNGDGIMAGLIAALASYAGVALFGAVAYSFQADDGAHVVAAAIGGSLLCGFGSFFVTSTFVIPGMMIVGRVLSSWQRSSMVGEPAVSQK